MNNDKLADYVRCESCGQEKALYTKQGFDHRLVCTHCGYIVRGCGSRHATAIIEIQTVYGKNYIMTHTRDMTAQDVLDECREIEAIGRSAIAWLKVRTYNGEQVEEYDYIKYTLWKKIVCAAVLIADRIIGLFRGDKEEG